VTLKTNPIKPFILQEHKPARCHSWRHN